MQQSHTAGLQRRGVKSHTQHIAAADVRVALTCCTAPPSSPHSHQSHLSTPTTHPPTARISMDRLAAIELQLVAHCLDSLCVLRLALCSRRMRSDLSDACAWKQTAAAPITVHIGSAPRLHRCIFRRCCSMRASPLSAPARSMVLRYSHWRTCRSCACASQSR